MKKPEEIYDYYNPLLERMSDNLGTKFDMQAAALQIGLLMDIAVGISELVHRNDITFKPTAGSETK